MKNFLDKTLKLIYLSIPILIIMLFYTTNNNVINFGNSISDEINMYDPFIYLMGMIMLFPFYLSILFFIKSLQGSQYNTSKIEKKVSVFFNKLKTITVTNKTYYLFIVLYGVLYFYSLLEITTLMKSTLHLFQSVNMITLDVFSNNNYPSEKSIQLILINTLFFFLFLFTKPKNQNKDFLFAFILLPLILSLFYVDKLIFNSILPQNISSEDFNFIEILSLGIKSISTITIGYFVVLTVIYALTLKSNKNKIRPTLLSILAGYAFHQIAIICGSVLFCYSTTNDYMKSEQNILSVNINETKYNINQSLLSEMENTDDEFMIESYVGLSMHNSAGHLMYMISEKFEGDKEKALLFTADITLRNLSLYNKKEAKIVKYLKNNNIDRSAGRSKLD